MAAYIVIVDFLGLAFAAVGFTMAFRQRFVRRVIGRPLRPSGQGHRQNDAASDPLTYVLRIAGVMIMIFGFVIAGMVTLFHLL